MKQILALIRLKPRYDYLAVVALALIITITNVYWVTQEQRPPHWDMGKHLFDSLKYYEIFSSGAYKHLITSYYYYPPFTRWVVLPFYAIFGISVPITIAANGLYVVILLISTYGITKDLWGRRAGILAALLVASAPMIVSQFKEYQIDAPLTAISTLCLWLLVRSRGFTSRRYSAALGISMGIAILTKWTFPLVFGLPLIWAVVESMHGKDLKYKLNNMLLCAALTLLIASPWVIHNRVALQHDLTANGITQAQIEGDPPVGTFAANVWYFKNLLNNQLYLIPTLMLIIGLGVTLMKRTNVGVNRYPLLLIGGTILAFTLTPNKDARYTLPMMGAVSVLSSFWIPLMKPWAFRVVAGVTLAYCVFVFWAVSFGTPNIPTYIINYHDTAYVMFAPHGYIIGAPTREQWHQEDVLRYIQQQPGAHTFSFSGPDTIWFNMWGLRYYSEKYGLTVVSPQEAAYRLDRSSLTICPNIVDNSYLLPDGTCLTLTKAGPST